MSNNIKINRSLNKNVDITIFESDYAANFYMKYIFIDLYGLFCRVTGLKTMNGIIKLNNGYLSSVIDRVDINNQSKNIVNLNNFLKNKGISLLYIQDPYKISKYRNELPIDKVDYSNQNTDELLNKLIKSDIKVLDLREEIFKEKLDHYSLFFKTDHHWKAESGFWAFTEISKYLEKEYKYKNDNLAIDIDNYNVVNYKNWFLGSQGKRTGIFFAGLDDVSLIYPKFLTNMTFEIPSIKSIKSGSFYNVVFDISKIEKKNYFELIPYGVYIGSDYPLVIQKNSNALNDKKILLLEDSFGLVVQPFLSLLYKEVDVLDLRYFTDMSLIKYVDTIKPDIVIIMYNPDVLNVEKMFDFGL